MKLIMLNNGLTCKVDDDDYPWLRVYGNWCYSKKDGHAYTRISMGGSGPGSSKYESMHRVIAESHGIIEADEYDIVVDHKDRDKLNNQKENLRRATRSQNSANRTKYMPNATSKYKGVSIEKRKGREDRYRATIRVDGKLHHLGYYNNPKEAALAYNEAAEVYFGEFAVLNIVDPKTRGRKKKRK